MYGVLYFCEMLLEKIKFFIDQKNLFSPEEKILLAVSGGIDSVCMAVIFSKAHYSFAIAHCNFQLRGEDSDADEKFVVELAIKYNVKYHVVKFDTQKFAADNKQNRSG